MDKRTVFEYTLIRLPPYIWLKVCEHPKTAPTWLTFNSKNTGINKKFFLPLLLKLPLFWEGFPQCWNMVAGICFHSDTVKPGTDVG